MRKKDEDSVDRDKLRDTDTHLNTENRQINDPLSSNLLCPNNEEKVFTVFLSEIKIAIFLLTYTNKDESKKLALEITFKSLLN